MDRGELTFEEARAAGVKRLERFVKFVFGEQVEVVNDIDHTASEEDTQATHTSAA